MVQSFRNKLQKKFGKLLCLKLEIPSVLKNSHPKLETQHLSMNSDFDDLHPPSVLHSWRWHILSGAGH